MSDPSSAGVEVVFGPRHPALQGVLRLRLTLDGESIRDCRPLIGYGHRGMEKLFEGFSLRDNVALTDRLDFVAAAAANLAWAGAVERLLGLAVPPRARYLRVLLAELQRLASHLLWLATAAPAAGVESVQPVCLRRRERVLDLLAAHCGARLTLRCALPGGLPRDADEAWLADCVRLAAEVPEWVESCERVLLADRAFKQRTVGLGVLSPEAAVDLGVTGPNLRATGVDLDLRRALPYDAYDELDLDVPTGQNGDAFDRFFVRLAELRQAALLIARSVECLPAGPVLAAADRSGAAGQGSGAGPGPAGPRRREAYFGVEGPRGEIGFYVALADGNEAGDGAQGSPGDPGARGRRDAAAPLDDTVLPWRCRVRAPSLYSLQALPEMARGHEVADLELLLASLDLALGEVDR